MSYKRIKIDLTFAQAKKALSGKAIRISKGQIGKGDAVSLHPANAKIVEKAALKNTGCNIHLTHGELADTAHHMNGSGFWSSIWNGVKDVWKVAKDSGALTKLADYAVEPLTGLANAYAPGSGGFVKMGRQLLKSTTGIGITRQTKAERAELLSAKGLYLS